MTEHQLKTWPGFFAGLADARPASGALDGVRVR